MPLPGWTAHKIIITPSNFGLIGLGPAPLALQLQLVIGAIVLCHSPAAA